MCAKKKSSRSTDPEKRRQQALKVVRDAFMAKLESESHREIQLPDRALPVEEIAPGEALARIADYARSVYNAIIQHGKPSLEVPSRSASNIIYDEENDLLLLGQDKVSKSHWYGRTNFVQHRVRKMEALAQSQARFS